MGKIRHARAFGVGMSYRTLPAMTRFGTTPMGLIARRLDSRLSLEDEAVRAILAVPHRLRALRPSEHFLREGERPKLDSLWVNVLEPGGTHSGHLHPHSVVSGTIYVAVPPGAGPLKLEDPRLSLMMAAPQRPGTFVYAEPKPGTIFLWESWLRHEVPAGNADEERISISFNYRL